MNRRSLIPVLWVAACFLAATAPRADSGGLERTYEMGVDARSIGMGLSGVALSGDAGSALSSNPALLATLAQGEALLYHAPLFESTRYDALAVAFPTLNTGTFGFSYIDVRTPDVESRDASDFLLGTFNDTEQTLCLEWAYPLPLKGLLLGASGRWYQQNIAGFSGDSYGLDLGLAWHREGRPWSLGLASEELYDSGLKLDTERETVPRGVRAGGSYLFTLPGGDLTASAEGKFIQGGSLQPAVGAEYLWHKIAAVRAGWDGQFRAGAGVKAGSWALQYALSFQQPAGITHKLSASLRFGRDVLAERRNRKSKEDQLKAQILEKLKNESINTYLHTGDQALAENRFDDAKAEYAKVLAWDPQNADAQERIQKTEKTSRVYNLRSKLADAKKLRADGNDLDAMVLYKAALEIDPQNQEAVQGLAQAGKRLRDASRKAFTTTSNLPPAEAQRTFEKGLELYLSGHYAQALDQWKVLVASNPLQRQVFDYVSRAQVRLESDKVDAELKQKAAVKADRLALLRQKAFEQYRKGDLKSAIDAWKEILKADPGNTEAKTELEKSQAELQNSMKRGVRW